MCIRLSCAMRGNVAFCSIHTRIVNFAIIHTHSIFTPCIIRVVFFFFQWRVPCFIFFFSERAKNSRHMYTVAHLFASDTKRNKVVPSDSTTLARKRFSHLLSNFDNFQLLLLSTFYLSNCFFD